MIEALIEGIIEVAAEVLLSAEVIAQALGWIGASLAWVLTLGRSEWKTDDWQSMAAGGLALMISAGLGASAWIHHSQGS